jgi:hypothetical protein
LHSTLSGLTLRRPLSANEITFFDHPRGGIFPP